MFRFQVRVEIRCSIIFTRQERQVNIPSMILSFCIYNSVHSKRKMKQRCKLKHLFFMLTPSAVFTLIFLHNFGLLHTSRLSFLGNLFAYYEADIECLNPTIWDNDTTEEFQRLEEVDIINCDYDYLHLQSQLQRWPEEKPKAFIYFLVRFENLQRLIKSLALLDEYFNKDRKSV